MDGRTPERCAECGFDATRWRVRDAVTLLDALGWWWRSATRGVDADLLNERPAPDVWSPLEYGAHTALVTGVLRLGIEAILADDDVTLPGLPDPPAAPTPATLESASVVDAVDREGHALAGVARDADPDRWSHVGWLAGRPVQAEAALLHAAHDASHHQLDVSRGLAAARAGTTPGEGRVVQVSVSAGGVPKRAVAEAAVRHDGLDGDHQADQLHHGRPFQAVCLWSADALSDLAPHGDGLAAGSVGENLTLAGVAWADLRAGTRLGVGSTTLELSFPAVPCHKQARWFTDRDFERLRYERHPEWARWYAWVREPGTVRPGDPVRVDG